MARAIAEAIIGQIYPAAILARLVTLELTHNQVGLLNYGAVDDYRFRATYVENTADPEDPDNGEYRTVRWGKLNVERVGA